MKARRRVLDAHDSTPTIRTNLPCCHAGWTEYAGINAPESEPVLTLVGAKDPWFRNHWNQGSCGRFLSKSNGSRSVVYSKGRLSTRHELLEAREVQQTVLDFLDSHRSR